MSNQTMDELSAENERLLNELQFERQMTECLVNIREKSLVLINNCKCNQNIDLFHDLLKFEKQFHSLKDTQRSRENECKTREPNEVMSKTLPTEVIKTENCGKSLNNESNVNQNNALVSGICR